MILDNERWKQADVPSALQSLVDSLVDGKKFIALISLVYFFVFVCVFFQLPFLCHCFYQVSTHGVKNPNFPLVSVNRNVSQHFLSYINSVTTALNRRNTYGLHYKISSSVEYKNIGVRYGRLGPK